MTGGPEGMAAGPTYSFVVPIFNDGHLAKSFCAEFEKVMTTYLPSDELRSEVELIFINDGSTNDSIEHLEQLVTPHPFVKVIDLSRNFGQHLALSCGYLHAAGRYVGMLNVDQQDPPDQIPRLLDAIRTGDSDIVYGLYEKRLDPAWTRFTSWLFNLILNKLTGYDVPANTATLRVMNRRFVDAYNQLTEKSRYLPGLEMWMGFRKGYTTIRHTRRQDGTSSYSFGRKALFALDTILSFSDLPLKIAVVMGAAIAIVGFLLTSILIVQRLFFVDFRPGYTTTVSLIVLLGGIHILFIGLASLYVGKILREVQNRPVYIVRSKLNF